MTVFKFALQKEFLTSTELLEQEAFLNQISTIGCLVYDNKDEFRKTAGSTPELSQLWKKVFSSRLIRVKKQTNSLLEKVQNTEKVEKYLKDEMLSLAVLEDDTASVLLEPHNHILRLDEENKEICHRTKIAETKAFQKAVLLRSKPIMAGDTQMAVWKARFIPILEDAYMINMVDRHFLKRAFGKIESTGQKKILHNLSLLKNLDELNIYCETPWKEVEKEDGKNSRIQYEEKELREKIKNELLLNKNIKVNFYLGGEYLSTAKTKNKRQKKESIFGKSGKSSFLQSFGYASEVITSDHLSELFDDKDGSKGSISDSKTFNVHKYNEHEDSKPIEDLNRLISEELAAKKASQLKSFIIKFGAMSSNHEQEI